MVEPQARIEAHAQAEARFGAAEGDVREPPAWGWPTGPPGPVGQPGSTTPTGPAEPTGLAPPSALSRSWAGFGLWAAGGVGVCLSLLGALTIGRFVLVPTVVLLVVLSMKAAGPAAWGALGGPAAPLFLVGWLNRHGPGTWCETTPTSEHCTEMWSPWPFALAATALAGLSVATYLRSRRGVTLERWPSTG